MVLRGVRPEDFKARTPLSAAIEGPAELRDRYRGLCRAEDDKPIDWGSLKDFGDDLVVIGRRLADLLKLKVGDNLQLVSPVEVATPLGVMPRSVQARWRRSSAPACTTTTPTSSTRRCPTSSACSISATRSQA